MYLYSTLQRLTYGCWQIARIMPHIEVLKNSLFQYCNTRLDLNVFVFWHLQVGFVIDERLRVKKSTHKVVAWFFPFHHPILTALVRIN